MAKSRWKNCQMTETENCTLWFDRKIHVYLLPDIRYRPLVSTAKEVTASKCATMTWVCFPVLLSKNRICRSSCAVIVSGSVGWDTTLVMRPTSAPSCNKYQRKIVKWLHLGLCLVSLDKKKIARYKTSGTRIFMETDWLFWQPFESKKIVISHK